MEERAIAQIPRAVERKRQAFRNAADGPARMLGPPPPSGSGQAAVDASQPTTTRQPDAESAAVSDEDAEVSGRHSMLRLLAAEYLLPLLPCHPRRHELLEAALEPSRSAFSPQEAIDCIVSSAQKLSLLFSHRFLLDPDQPDTLNQSAPVTLWILPRLFASYAALFSHPPTQSADHLAFATRIVQGASELANQASLLTASRLVIAPVLRAVFASALRSFTAAHRPSFSQSHPDLGTLLQDPRAAPASPTGQSTLTLLPEGLTFPPSWDPKAPSSVCVLWMCDDDMALTVDLSVRDVPPSETDAATSAAAARFARATLSALVTVLAPLSRHDAAHFASFAITVTRAWLDNWRLDLATASAPPPGGPPSTHVSAAVAATRVMAAIQLVPLVGSAGLIGLGCHAPCAVELALSQVDVYLPLTPPQPDATIAGAPPPIPHPMSDAEAYAQLSILKRTTSLLQAIRASKSSALGSTVRAVLLPRAGDLVAFVTAPSYVSDSGTEESASGSVANGASRQRLVDDVLNWSKAYAWEALLCLASPFSPNETQNKTVLADAVALMVANQATAHSSQTQPAPTFLVAPTALGSSPVPAPSWMLPAQVQDTRTLLAPTPSPMPTKRTPSLTDNDASEEGRMTKRSRSEDKRKRVCIRPGPDARWTLEEIVASPPLPLDPFADSDQFARAALRMCAYAHGMLSHQAAAQHSGQWACSVCDVRAPTMGATSLAIPSTNYDAVDSPDSKIGTLVTASIATPDQSKALDRVVRRLKSALSAHSPVSSSPPGGVPIPQTQADAVAGVSPALIAKALQAFRRILAHCQESSVDDMDYIELFEMVKAALVVRSRACNVAAMALMGTVGRRFELFYTVYKEHHALLVLNCINALHTQLLSLFDPRITATAVESLGRIGQIESDTLLENALIKLVEAFGSGPYTASLAYTQVAALARFKGRTAFQLLRPYLGQLGPLVVLKSSTAPSLLAETLRLTGVSKASFLETTKYDVVPALIKGQQFDLLQAVAKELNRSVPKLCNEAMPFVLRAILLADPKTRQTAIDQLIRLFPGQVTFAQLLRPYSSDVLGHLVLALGLEEKHPLVRSALEFVYTTVTSTSSRSGLTQRSSKNTPSFISWLGSEAMAIHAWLCEELVGDHGRRSDSERRVVIQAFARLIDILGFHVSSIIPQLNTTLTSSLSKPPLRLSVLRAWNTLLGGLGASDMTLYLGQTIAALATVWEELDDQEKVQAKAMITGLINMPDHLPSNRMDTSDGPSDDRGEYTVGAGTAARGVLARVHVSGPILDAIPAWAELRRAHALSRGERPELEAILDDLASDNAALVLQTLTVLRQFLREHQQFVHVLTSGNQFDPLVERLLDALLAIPARLDLASTMEQNGLAFECLGLVGAVDPDRVYSSKPQPKSKAVGVKFGDPDATADFALELVRDLLVKAFRTTDNSAHQVKLAFAIQELLKICGFTPALLDAPQALAHSSSSNANLGRPGRVLQRWRSLPSHMLDTIGPLLCSHYAVEFKDGPPRPLPLCTSSSTYAEWLQNWTGMLIKATRDTPAHNVFSVFRPVVLEHDLSIAQYILPHLILAVLVYGEQASRDQIHTELLAVLRSLTETSSGSGGQDQQQPTILKMAQTVFGLLDHLGDWLRRKRMDAVAAATSRARTARAGGRVAGDPDQQQDNEAIIMIESVLDNIRPSVLAHASFETQSWARSLLHFEQTVRLSRQMTGGFMSGSSYDSPEMSEELQGIYEKMHCIYAALDEPDGMEGITTLVVDPSLEHQIREHESTGRWTAAQSCWELKLQNDPINPDLHKGLLNCLRNLGHYDTMQTHIRGALSQHPEWQSFLGAYEVEGACLLSHWEEVARLVDLPSATSDKHALARLLLAIRMDDSAAVKSALTEARHQFGEPMVGAGDPKYERVYESVLNLQSIADLDLIYNQASRPLQETKEMLISRVSHTLPTFRIREVLLSAHRSGFSALRSAALDPSDAVAAAWVQTSKFARRSDHRQTAYSAMLQAQQLHAQFAFVQRAKLLVLDDQLQSAIQVMDNALESMDLGPATLANLSDGERAATAKAALLRTNIMERTGRYERNDVLESYKRVAAIDENAERAWYAHGHYADTFRDGDDGNPLRVDLNVVKSLLRALGCGTKYFFRALPRVLTIWLDNGEKDWLVVACQSGKPDTHNEGGLQHFLDINARINKAANYLPAYQWLAVFPQLVCRVTHKNDMVFRTLRQIIIRVIQEYPAQAMWAVVGGIQSKDNDRRKRFKDILSKVKQSVARAASLDPTKHDPDVVEAAKGRSTGVFKAVEQAAAMAHELLNLCNYAVASNVKLLSMQKHFPSLVKLPTDHLLLPLQSSLIVSLPATNLIDPKHQPFPDVLPRIKGFDDQIEVLSSLQKPRKITIKGTDGSAFNFLCKPKDDLRKDARLMDFDAMINKLLQANADSRRRKLYIRTYGVVTLNEECGLIEWVPNTIGLRHVLASLYKAHGKVLYSTEIKNLFEQIRQNQRRAADIFSNSVLPLYPPVFHEWFVATFPEPSAWLSARLRYARTAAVMSMVGHVLGLGDRHGENILFDAISGDTVHVDLNCLFEKGHTFEIPERVPFRLTHNMVDAMGVTGVDGVFRRAAEVSMTILRDNKDSLMSVLEAMIHDPLVEWTSSRKKGQNGVDPRMAEARNALTTVRNKLEGYKTRHVAPGLCMSTPNLVDSLIRDATSPTNLALMYIGWASYL